MRRYLNKYLLASEAAGADIWTNQQLAAAIKNLTAVFSRPDSPRMTSHEVSPLPSFLFNP